MRIILIVIGLATLLVLSLAKFTPQEEVSQTASAVDKFRTIDTETTVREVLVMFGSEESGQCLEIPHLEMFRENKEFLPDSQTIEEHVIDLDANTLTIQRRAASQLIYWSDNGESLCFDHVKCE